MATYEDIIYDKKEHIAQITFNRPKMMNALRERTWVELVDALRDASVDTSVGVIVITGAGDRAFAAGGDLKEGETPEVFRLGEEALRQIVSAPQPVIAAVNGYAIGSGNWMPVICDLTIASENARFGQTGPRVGSPASGYMVSYLARVVGEKKAREMWMLCRQYTAQEALEMGLVNKVVPQDKLMEEVNQWCQEILSLSPTVLKLVKYSFRMASDYMHTPHQLSLSGIVAPKFNLTEESKEGVNAFLEKRKTDFNKFRK